MLITSDNHVVRIWDPETVGVLVPALIFLLTTVQHYLEIDTYPLGMITFVHTPWV